MAYSPLGRGFLTGTIAENTTFEAGDLRTSLPRFDRRARTANRAVVDVLEEMAARLHASPAQIALAWLLARVPPVIPIPGTTKLIRIEENVASVHVAFSSEDIARLEGALGTLQIKGARYPEELEARTGL